MNMKRTGNFLKDQFETYKQDLGYLYGIIREIKYFRTPMSKETLYMYMKGATRAYILTPLKIAPFLIIPVTSGFAIGFMMVYYLQLLILTVPVVFGFFVAWMRRLQDVGVPFLALIFFIISNSTLTWISYDLTVLYTFGVLVLGLFAPKDLLV